MIFLKSQTRTEQQATGQISIYCNYVSGLKVKLSNCAVRHSAVFYAYAIHYIILLLVLLVCNNAT